MPPRAVGRRGTRLSSRDPDFTSSSPNPQPALQKPNLPKLAGTPASRRQYTYGSGVEPPPSRPGRGLRLDQPLDLGNAVENLLSRQELEDTRPPQEQMPPPQRPSRNSMERDELADDANGEAAGRGQRRSQRRTAAVPQRAESEDPPPHLSARSQLELPPQDPRLAYQVDDLRDDRSFGTESDYYGDATIVSTPRASPAVSDLRRQWPPSQLKSPSNLRHARQPDSEEPDELSTTESTPRSQPLHAARSAHQAPTEPSPSGHQPQAEPDADAGAHSRKRLRLREPPRRLSRSPLQGAPALQPAGDQLATVEESEVTGKATSLFRPVQRLFQRTPQAKSGSTGISKLDGGYASNHSEADDAIQRDIEASETRAAPRQEPWRDRWLRMDPLSPFRLSNRQRSSEQSSELAEEESDEEEIEEEEEEPEDDVSADDTANTAWFRFLNPWPYLDALLQLIDRFNDWISTRTSTLFALFDLLWFMKVLGMTVLVVFVAVGISQPGVEESVRDSLDSIASNTLSGFEGLASWASDRVSSIHFPFSRDDDLSGLWDLGDEGLHEVEDYLRKYDQDFKLLKKAGKLHEASLEKLQQVVPKVVHMELQNGKPVVAPEFWFAIRDLLRGDGGFLTIDDKGGGKLELSSDRHWRAIAARLASDPSFTSKVNLTMDGIEERINTRMSSFWDGWIKDNDSKISSKLGSALDMIKSAASEHELNDVVKKLVKDQLHNEHSDGVVVTRDEFLRHLQNEFAVHRSEIRAELNELRPKMEELLRESAKLASAKDPNRPAGMTREDVTSLVQGLVRKALADTNLEALARGKIHAHWDTELKTQVNYFSVGAGAIADAKLSSPTYDPYKKGVLSRNKANGRGLRDARPPPHIAALTPWHDEGDCWCAARQTNYRGNPHDVVLSVILGHQIIPQDIVIEHILPGATVDPGSRPRDIEIHASIEDPAKRERIRDFAATHFPELDPSTEDWNATPANLEPRFVKIGQFTYETDDLHHGVHVHRLSNELLALGAETDQVVVRATSNYGAAEHTCFYRVRLYGQRVSEPRPARDDPAASPPPAAHLLTRVLFAGPSGLWNFCRRVSGYL